MRVNWFHQSALFAEVIGLKATNLQRNGTGISEDFAPPELGPLENRMPQRCRTSGAEKTRFFRYKMNGFSDAGNYLTEGGRSPEPGEKSFASQFAIASWNR
jgi:hypothetical protein